MSDLLLAAPLTEEKVLKCLFPPHTSKFPSANTHIHSCCLSRKISSQGQFKTFVFHYGLKQKGPAIFEWKLKHISTNDRLNMMSTLALSARKLNVCQHIFKKRLGTVSWPVTFWSVPVNSHTSHYYEQQIMNKKRVFSMPSILNALQHKCFWSINQ